MWLTLILLSDGITLKSSLNTAVRTILMKCQLFSVVRPKSTEGFPAKLRKSHLFHWATRPTMTLSPHSHSSHTVRSLKLLGPSHKSHLSASAFLPLPSPCPLLPRWLHASLPHFFRVSAPMSLINSERQRARPDHPV